MRLLRICAASAVVLIATGCITSLGGEFWSGKVVPGPVPSAPGSMVQLPISAANPENWSEPWAMEIREFRASGSAVVGTSVTVTAIVVIGSSSCNKLERVDALLNEHEKTVTITAFGRSKKPSGTETLTCDADVSERPATVDFTPLSTGTYLLIDMAEQAHHYYEGHASFSIDVLPASSP